VVLNAETIPLGAVPPLLPLPRAMLSHWKTTRQKELIAHFGKQEVQQEMFCQLNG
jgi:hypothetical protein